MWRCSASCLVGALALLVASVLPAATVPEPIPVSNYNWLQLRASDVTASVGGGVGGGNGYGAPADVRWGVHVWIPDGTMTSNGNSRYWAALKFDQSRQVTNVWVQWWTQEGTGLSNYFIDGSSDGTNWVLIGQKDYGLMSSNQARNRDKIVVTNGLYQYVRVRLEPGGYRYANAGRGGPGIYSIEPLGDGIVDSTHLNWANQPNFGTTAAINGLGFNGTRFNDGYLYDDEGTRTGNNPGNWDPGDYAQIDLKQNRRFDTVTLVWDSDWYGTNCNVAYSTDGTNYLTATNRVGPFYNDGFHGSMEIRFDPVLKARYVRVQDLTTPTSYALFNQFLVLGAGPEPPGTLMQVR